MKDRKTLLHDFAANLRSFDWSELRYVSACGSWPSAVYIVVCVSSLVLVALLSSALLAPGMRAAWHEQRAQTAALERKLSALHEQAGLGSARDAGVAWLFPQWAWLYKHLQPADPLPVVIDRVGGAAAEHGVTVAALRPEPLWKKASMRAFEIEMQMSAKEQQLAAFLTDVRRLPFVIVVKNLNWNMASGQARMTLVLLVDDNGMLRDRSAAGDPDRERANRTPYAGLVSAAAGAGWQRVAYIRRGNRYLEVLRDEHGQTRRRAGQMPEVEP